MAPSVLNPPILGFSNTIKVHLKPWLFLKSLLEDHQEGNELSSHSISEEPINEIDRSNLFSQNSTLPTSNPKRSTNARLLHHDSVMLHEGRDVRSVNRERYKESQEPRSCHQYAFSYDDVCPCTSFRVHFFPSSLLSSLPVFLFSH